MNYLVDAYSGGTDAELCEPGCLGSSEYVSRNTAKCVTTAKVQHVHSLGKWVSLNFEDAATNAKGGASQGAADGEFFVSVASGQLRAPRGVAGYASVDFEATTAQITDDVCPYFSTWTPKLHAAGFLSGAYGDYDVGVALLKARLIDLFWQTVAWSDGKRVVNAVLLQDTFTNGYDKDELLQSFIGAWTPSGPQKRPTPTPAPTPEDDVSAADVTTALNSPEGQAAIQKAVNAAPITFIGPDGKVLLDAHGKPVESYLGHVLGNVDQTNAQILAKLDAPA